MVADSKSVEERPIAENDFTEPPLIFNGRWDIPLSDYILTNHACTRRRRCWRRCWIQ